MNRKDYWFTVTGRNEARKRIAACSTNEVCFILYCFILVSSVQCFTLFPIPTRLTPSHRAALES